ncbi:SurA N-terminal domain-containing protein [Castellaniella sp. GW247-6E4]|uniref:SurA N-terminal domain-containing protein n=1 Tax=Castellaniella sp. GW247-6E4 TaxID=3140380 RepID=UPI003314F8B5
MFEFIRTHQRLMQLILLILVVPSFALIGVSGYSTYVSGDHAIAEVGKASVTQEEFDEARRNQLQQMQAGSQGRFDPALLDNPPARRALLDQLIDRRVQILVATKDHFSVSDGALRRAIAAMPQLQVDGQFSADRYNEALASAGLSPRDFEAGQRAELALDRVLGPVGDTAGLPKPVLDEIKRALTEERTIGLRVFKPVDYGKGIQVDDADIEAWYKAHQDALRLPEQVSASYVVLDEAAALASVPTLDEPKLKEYYEQNKAKYVVPARVNVSHILVKLPAGATEEVDRQALDKARGLAERARAEPSQFAELARKESQDAGTARSGGELGWIQRGVWPLNLEQAVFALAKGEVSEPVKGQDGYHVFIANDKQAEKGETFAEARVKVEDEVRHQLAAERFADMATKLTGLVYDNPTSLEPAAKALGLELRRASGIARDRLLDEGEGGVQAASASADAATLGDVRVRQALFSSQVLTDKQNSGVIEISPDTMLAVRVDAVEPAHVPALDRVRDRIREQLVAERTQQATVAAGEAALQTLLNAQEPSSEDFGEPATISRLNPMGLSKVVLEAAFKAPTAKLPSYAGTALAQGYAIIRVDQVKAGSADNPALNGLGAQLAQVWADTEERAVMANLRQQLKVKITADGEKLIEGEDQR